MFATLYLWIRFGQPGQTLNYLSKSFPQAFMICGLLAFGGIFVSCGKRRPPIPPTRSVASDYLSAVQRGNKVLLKITIPPQKKDVKQISIYRLNEALNNKAPLSEDDFNSKSTLIGVADPLSGKTPNVAFYDDELSNVGAANRLRYAVRLVFADGRRSALSNFLMVEPTFRVPLPPVLTNPVVSQSAIQLQWQKPETNLDSTTPANVVGYNIYRAQDEVTGQSTETAPQLLNSAPVTETSFKDAAFQFGKSYRYFVRAVSSTSGSNNTGANPALESLDSNVQAVIPKDIFAPAAPQNLTIAAAPGQLSLFFAANSETDLAGYLIYRSNDDKTPLAQWPKTTPNLLTTNSFQDSAVESGQKYFYYLKAVDQAGNISEPSEIVAETAP